jgi:hypothetical protein
MIGVFRVAICRIWRSKVFPNFCDGPTAAALMAGTSPVKTAEGTSRPALAFPRPLPYIAAHPTGGFLRLLL